MGIGKAPPLWAALITEMMVQDYDRSLAFWTKALGFAVDFTRPAQKLACLTHPDGAQVMIYERDGYWETGVMEPPFGRGAVTVSYTHLDVYKRQRQSERAKTDPPLPALPGKTVPHARRLPARGGLASPLPWSSAL